MTVKDIRLECYSKFRGLSRRLMKKSRKHLHSMGFAWNQYSVLKNLDVDESITLSQLSQRTSRDSSNITALVDFLEERGIVRRVPDKSDRRVIRLELTEEGKHIRSDTIESHEEFIKSMFADIPDEKIHKFIEVLDFMYENMDLSKN